MKPDKMNYYKNGHLVWHSNGVIEVIDSKRKVKIDWTPVIIITGIFIGIVIFIILTNNIPVSWLSF
jgi:hypothetical protein